MEKQVVTITVITEGEECEMTDQAIIDWYKKHVSEIFNPQYGTPQISVKLERTELK